MSHQTVAAFNFFKGHPSTELLPTKQILTATTSILKRFDNTDDSYDGFSDTHPLNYGPDLGNLEVRKLIADWNTKNFKLEKAIDPECINLTSGSSYGLMNILTQFSSPHNNLTKRAFLVSPTYFLFNAAFIDAGFGEKMTSITEFNDGQIDFKKLENELIKCELEDSEKFEITPERIKNIYDPDRPLKHIFKYILYIVPTFSNPKGGSLTASNREKLIEIARKFNILIICDDVYDLLDYRTNSNYYKRLVHYDRDTLPTPDSYGNVVSNATFSKILGPGLRVGYQETPTEKLAYLLSQGGAHRSGGTPSHLNTVIVGELLRTGVVDEFVAKLVQVYSKRVQVCIKAINDYLPVGTQISNFEGGYFCWVTLPEGYDSLEISKKCSAKGVILATGDNFEVTGDEQDWGKSGVRLSISHLKEEKIEEGIKIWGEICKAEKS
ncbi:hypothetical protein CANARDRAFT_7343 [[Candida] arabinofermentans NRRL YB-2248]|uniref:Aminotransferase class I/classII large domain-containing protein n=1 Tax=[Candida] arabinofermentans NRRL YB-2248 TaxID=983967 RepID=A0A1E4T2N7_9ASCO|nr:hypothetical protein CANARDRAFT_7343 [[Candida] arabinofermentans NRRL YB-2248]